MFEEEVVPSPFTLKLDVLSGLADHQDVTVNLTFTSACALKIDACPSETNLDNCLRRFWELESLGIARDETSVYDKFVQQITFDGQRYEVSLPWTPTTLGPL